MNMGISKEYGTSASTYVVAGLAVIGMVLGAAGLYTGMAAKGLEDRVNERMTTLEQRVMSSDDSISQLNSNFRTLLEKSQAAFGEVNNQLTDIRSQLPAKKETKTVEAAEAPEGGAPAEAKPQSTAASSKTHVIKAGDTFPKLAKTYGTTVAALQKANPKVNPSKLKVGQKVNLP